MNDKMIAENFDFFNENDKTLPEDTHGQLKEIVKTFDTAVDTLRDTFPNPSINQFANLLWRIIGNKVVPLAAMDTIESVSFMCEVKNSKLFVAILVPLNWVQLFKADPFHQMGGMIFNGSKAIDWYTGILIAEANEKTYNEKALERGLAWEAEFLNSVKNIKPDYKFSDYQNHVLEKYPKGIASAKGLVYYVPEYDHEVALAIKKNFQTVGY